MLQQVVEMIAAMLLVAASWTALAVLFTGAGLLVRRAWGRGRTGGPRAAQAFWMGLAVAVGLVQLWHLVLPATPVVLVVLACASAAGFALGGRGLLRLLRVAAGRHKLAVVVAALLAVWLSNRAIGPPLHTDSGLYHLQVVRWYRQYPAVPGLGNLHWRFASNNANLLLAASLEAGPLTRRSAHVVNSLLIYALMVHAVAGATRLFSHGRAARAQGAFDAALLVMSVQMSNHWMVSSHSTDVLPAVCSAIATSYLAGLLLGRARSDADRSRRILLVVALLATAVCAKLTAAPFALAAAVLTTGWWLRIGRPGGLRTALAAGVTVALLLVPWVVHGLILSGRPLYPLAVLPAEVDWRMPDDVLAREWEHIAESGRAFGPLSRWESWKQLAGRWQRDVLFPSSVAVVAAGALAVLRLRRGRLRTARLWVLLAPVAVSIVVWLAVSPQRRMGFHLFWIAAATMLAISAFAHWPRPGRKTLTLLLALWVILAAGNLKKVYTPPAAGGFHRPPSPELTEQRTRCGLKVLVPEDGFCWDAPTPATPHVHPNLRMRRPGDLSAGFTTGE